MASRHVSTLHLGSGETAAIARLFGFLLLGERLAQELAAQQASLAPVPKWRHFLQQQARQEGLHATVFEGAVRWCAPRSRHAPPGLPSLQRYRQLAQAAIARGDLAESVIALQVVFEAVGDVVLAAIDAGIARRGGGFVRLRRVLRHQEQAHHAFGMHLLNVLVSDDTHRQGLRAPARDYLELVDTMFTELDGLFQHFDEDPAAYLAAFRCKLPGWLTA